MTKQTTEPSAPLPPALDFATAARAVADRAAEQLHGVVTGSRTLAERLGDNITAEQRGHLDAVTRWAGEAEQDLRRLQGAAVRLGVA